MFHTVIEAGADGEVLTGPGKISKSGTAEVVLGKHLTRSTCTRCPSRGWPPGGRTTCSCWRNGSLTAFR